MFLQVPQDHCLDLEILWKSVQKEVKGTYPDKVARPYIRQFNWIPHWSVADNLYNIYSIPNILYTEIEMLSFLP